MLSVTSFQNTPDETITLDAATVELSGTDLTSRALGYNVTLINSQITIAGQLAADSYSHSDAGITRTYALLQDTNNIRAYYTTIEGVDLDDAMTGNTIKAGDNTGEDAVVKATNSFTQQGASLKIESSDANTGGDTRFETAHYIFDSNNDQTLSFKKNPGTLEVKIGTLDLTKTQSQVAVDFQNATGQVKIETLRLGAGNKLTLSSDSTGYQMQAVALDIQGSGAEITLYNTNLDVSGQTLTFDLSQVVVSAPMLNVSSYSSGSKTINLTNATITFSGTDALAHTLGASALLIRSRNAMTGQLAADSYSFTDAANIKRTYTIFWSDTKHLYTRFSEIEGDDLTDAMTGHNIIGGWLPGQDAIVKATGTFTQTDGVLYIYSSDNATGGNTSFSAATYIPDGSQLQTLSIAKQAGDFNVNIGTLDLTNTYVNDDVFRLELIETAADDVKIGALKFNGDNHLRVIALNAAMLNPMALEVRGTGNLVNDPGNILSFAGKTLTFVLPANAGHQDVMLDFGDNAAVDITGATVVLQAGGHLRGLNAGEHVVLINGSSNATDGSIANTGEHAVLYGSTEYLFDVQHNSPLTATLLGKAVNESYAKAYMEGALASLATVNLGQDTLVNQGLPIMLGYTNNRAGLRPFATFGASTQKIDSGSHVDVDGYTVMGGLALGFDNAIGRTTLGAFIEGGWGNSSTYNNFSTSRIKGDTDSDYFGGGVMARHDFEANTIGNLYADASVRGGRIKTDFKSHDMGADAKYDASATYFGGHAGLGFVWRIYEGGSLDTYGRVLWTRQGSDTATTDAGERLKINDADSVRTQLGARLNHEIYENVGVFAGLGWEHEYDGKLNGKLNGVNIASPKMQGDSGFAELGLKVNVADSISIQAAGQGFVGQREGISGSLGLSIAF